MEGKFLFPSRVGDSRSLQCQRTNLGRLSEIILKDPSPPRARLLPLAIATHCQPREAAGRGVFRHQWKKSVRAVSRKRRSPRG